MEMKLICVSTIFFVLFLDSSSGASLGLGSGLGSVLGSDSDSGLKVAEINLLDDSSSSSSTSVVQETKQETDQKPGLLSVDADLLNQDLLNQDLLVPESSSKDESSKITVIEIAPSEAPETPVIKESEAPQVVVVPVPVSEAPVVKESEAPQVVVVPVPVTESSNEPVTTSSLSDDEIKPIFLCPYVDTEKYPMYVGLYANEDDCSTFFHCSNGVAYLKKCGGGLIFDPELNVCNFPNAVKNANCKMQA